MLGQSDHADGAGATSFLQKCAEPVLGRVGCGWGAGCILPHPRPHLSIWWELVQNQSSSHLGLINNVLAENLLLLLLEASPAPPKEPVTCIRLGIHATQSGEDGSPPSRLECPHVSSLPRKQGHLSPEPSHRPSHSPRSPQRKSSILEV